MMTPCPITACATDLQPVMFEGRMSLAAGIAAHLQTVHRWDLQHAWHAANSAAAEATR